jgi:hypothetical protein
MENIGFEVPPPEARPQTPDELGVKGEGLSRLPSFGARPSPAGRRRRDRPSHYSLECDCVFPRSVNQRSAQPHLDGNRHDRRPIDRGIPNRQNWASAGFRRSARASSNRRSAGGRLQRTDTRTRPCSKALYARKDIRRNPQRTGHPHSVFADSTAVINAQTLPKVQMPNRNGFITRFPERTPPQ